MSIIHSFLGISSFPQELQNLSLKYFCLQVVVSGIFLSYSWISLYYISVLDSFSTFGTIVAIGMICGAFLDIPLGLLTDRFGQRIAFCCALSCLTIYYLGIIVASQAIDFLLLEIVVGLYSALLSGSFITWFMNSWEVIAAKKNETELSFRAIMGNINFAKTLIIAFATLIGGYLLQQKAFHPQMVFFFQALIAACGVLLGFKFISTPTSFNETKSNERRNNESDCPKNRNRYAFVRNRYLKISPIFIGFSILLFTSISFTTLILAPLIYEMSSDFEVFKQKDVFISFTSISILLISVVRAVSDVVHAFASRLSGRFTSFIKSPYHGLVSIYIFTFPIAWFYNIGVLIIDLPSIYKISLIILIYFLRIVLSGLSTGLYWQFYLTITSSEIRSSQESLFNTINLIVSIFGFAVIGIIIESNGFIDALLFLLFASIIGIFLLLSAGKCAINLEDKKANKDFSCIDS
ncbi:MAG: MFS transporter [Candidatus Hodarchaeales archaeon]|jgi:MFS family permease